MPKPDFVLVGHHRQVQRRVKPLLRFRKQQPVAFVYRAPQALYQFRRFHYKLRPDSRAILASVPFGHSSSSSNPALPLPAAGAAGRGKAGTACRGDNWQYCRSLKGCYRPCPQVYWLRLELV